MSGGCTECGNKGGCDHRKGAMMAAVGDALTRLYPAQRWAERDEQAAFRGGVPRADGIRLAELRYLILLLKIIWLVTERTEGVGSLR